MSTSNKFHPSKFQRSKLSVAVGALALGIAILLTQSGCKSDAQASASQMPRPQVTAAAAIAREVVDWDEFTGRLEAVQTVEIRPRVGGYVESVNFADGSVVREGQLLFVIDPRPYQAELARAEAELARAQARAELAARDLDRSEKLLDGRVISQELHDQRLSSTREAQAALQSANAGVEVARLNLSYTRITSPIAGRVSKANVTRGNLVANGNTATLLTTVVSMDPIYVSFEGDEQVYLKYVEQARRGERPSSRDARNPVHMGLANESGYPHEGHMVFVDNQVDTRTGTIRARAAFDNKDGYLTPGLFARVQLLGSGKRAAVLVDDRAVGTDQNQKFVYVVGESGDVSYRKVKPGRLADGLRVIEAGIAPGELVIIDGVQRVRPGVAVAVEKVAMERPRGAAQLAANLSQGAP